MAESEFNAQFFEQFLDDYYAESDEHLRSVLRNILDLEDSLNTGRPAEAGTLNELFRSFHTIKGISAMASVSEAETLAHYMESYLRLLRDGEARISESGLKALIRSTQKIEEIVALRRSGGEMPSIIDETALLDSLVAENENLSSGSSSGSQAEAVKQRYLFTFVSAPQLAERNINVNSIRERLTEIGSILKSAPTVRSGGQVAFEFTVETAADAGAFASWAEDGIEFELLIEHGEQLDGVGSQAAQSGLLVHTNFVRVELSRLDELMLMVGELVVSRARLSEQIKQISKIEPSEQLDILEETENTIERQLRNLRDGVMRTRMTPIGEVFERLQFAVRDLARESRKKIKVEITGENTEIDKMLVEKVVDPLLHLVRNAVSHGIEDAAERKRKDKPEVGCIRLHAETAGESIVLKVGDDGSGIDEEKVLARARERGMWKSAVEPDDAELLEILTTPGFSTRDEADMASGRGVGMDVVRRVVTELNGVLSLDTAVNTGTTFRIQLPLTLAIADALIVAVDDQRFAVPQAGVREVIEIEHSSVRNFENNEIIEYRGAALPLVRLSKLFALKNGHRNAFHAFVVGEGKNAVGVAVDRIIGQAEIVIRAVTDPLAQAAGISGATELGDGHIVLILDVDAVTRRLKDKI